MGMVIEHLDVNADRAAFLSLLRVSCVYWEMAARVLYRNIDISGTKLRKLLRSKTANRNELSTRQRTALSFIKRLNLRDPEARTLSTMSRVAIPSIPLFPNVHKVHIYCTKPAHDDDLFEIDVDGWPRPERDLIFFSSPDMCSWDSDCCFPLGRFHTRTIGTLSVHSATAPILATPFRVQYWHKSGSVTLYITHVDSICLFHQEKVTLGLALPPGNSYIRSQARVWVGDYSSEYDQDEPRRWPISIGPWEGSADVDCRMDSEDHQLPPCPVCGGKGDLGARNFGCVFTVAW